jgi:outer membrane immunogenic protein
MKTRVATIAIALAAIGAATSASAADLGRGSVKDRVPYYPPAAYTGPFTLTGFYLGLQTGYVWGDASHSFSDGSFGGSSEPDGWVGGGYAGYNWQSGNFVFGLEGDIEGGDVGGSFRNAAGTVWGSTDLDWQGSLRARMGIAAYRTLFYITGGWALAQADEKGSTSTPVGCCGFSADLDGWTLGAGIEYAFTNNFVVRSEYRYTDFGSVTGNIGGGVNMPVDLHTNAVRIGASWKF